MRGFVGNTDIDWFRFLRDRSPVDEVNFWQPSGGTSFRALQPGEPFFLRLKSPFRAIAGFGYFARHSVVPAWLAWDSFGDRNGAPDFPTMCRRIEKYRRTGERDPAAGYRIGCLMIAQPVFFPDDAWVREPEGFSPNIVRGMGLDLAGVEGQRIWAECRERAAGIEPLRAAAVRDSLEDRPVYGQPTLIRPRLGQGTFRVAVTDAYGRACAITHEHSLPVLDVAHIRPLSEGGSHAVSNGLLLRTDIHRLFDRGYVTVTPEFKFEVSPRLRKDFDNGRTYYALNGQAISVPSRDDERPQRDHLEWHNEAVFLGTAA